MNPNKQKFLLLLSIVFLTISFNSKATAPPTALKIANSVASGNWNNPAIWSNGKVPGDSTFVIIKSGNNVVLMANSNCESLVIEKNASLDNGIYELKIKFKGWAHGINDSGYDNGVSLFGYAPIDSTWSISNPNNACWNIYKVDGTHSGTGNILIFHYEYFTPVDNWSNYFGGTITGSGTITNTGILTIIGDPNTHGPKFNSACNLTLHCSIDITAFLPYYSYGLHSYNFGKIHLVGANTFFVAGSTSPGIFYNQTGAEIIIDNGNLYTDDSNTGGCQFFNHGKLILKNGDIVIGDGSSHISNYDSIIVNGNILGNDTNLINFWDPSIADNLLVQDSSAAVIMVTGEIFPAQNPGALVASGGLNNPSSINHVIYNGSASQNIVVPLAIDGVTQIPYSVLKTTNSGVKTISGNIEINDTLIIAEISQLSSNSVPSFDIKMNNASTWKDIGSHTNPFIENTGSVYFTGTSNQKIICNNSTGETFYNLIINNPTGVNLLVTDANVTDTLSLLNGVVTTGNNKIHLSNSLAGSLSNFGLNSFINGNFTRNIASNTNTYSFPLGYTTNSTSYYRADILNNNMIGVSFINANVNSIIETGNNIDTQISTFQNSNPITDVINTAVWNFTPNAPPTTGDFGVKLFTQNITGLTDNMFFAVKRPTASIDYVDWNTFSSTTIIPALNTPGRTIASGYAEKTGFSSFSQFAIGTVSSLTTSLDDYNNSLLNGINIYPIPASNIVNIDLSNVNAKNSTIELYDVLGNKITKAIPINNNLYIINRNNLASGIYLLKTTIDGKIHSRKILFE